MAVALLEYANREKVAQALTARGYQVSRNTVNRWARGDEMPDIAARMIASLFGHKEEAAPDVPERLDKIESYLKLIARGVPVSPELLADIESAHRDAAGVAPERQRSDAARRKADRRPRGK